MKLINVEINKYKSFESTQSFEVQNDITILVGMNESGKTSVLEAIAKTKYFQEDSKFKFNLTHDYPRREKKGVDKSNTTPVAIKCTYQMSEKNIKDIELKVGKGVFDKKLFQFLQTIRMVGQLMVSQQIIELLLKIKQQSLE